MSITAIAVSDVLRITLLFPDKYQTEPASKPNTIKLKITDPVRTHIPERASAMNERTAIFFGPELFIVALIASTKNRITSNR